MTRESEIGLAELLSQLRAELSAAQKSGDGQPLRFEVTEAEVELEVSVSREAGPAGKVKIDVVAVGGVEFGAEAKRTAAHTHRITLKLSVTDEATGSTAIVKSGTRRDWNE